MRFIYRLNLLKFIYLTMDSSSNSSQIAGDFDWVDGVLPVFLESELDDVFAALDPVPAENSSTGPYPTRLDRFSHHFETGCWTPLYHSSASGSYSPTDLPFGRPFSNSSPISVASSGRTVIKTSPDWYSPSSPTYYVRSSDSGMGSSGGLESASTSTSDELFPSGCVRLPDLASMEGLYRNALDRSIHQRFSYRLPTVVKVTHGLDGFAHAEASFLDPCVGPHGSRMIELRQYVDELCRSLDVRCLWRTEF